MIIEFYKAKLTTTKFMNYELNFLNANSKKKKTNLYYVHAFGLV